MDIPTVFSNSSDASDDARIKPTDGDNVTMVPSGQALHDSNTLDPLASFGIGMNANADANKSGSIREELVKNDTISTSDKSGVGDFKKIMEQFPEPTPEPMPEPTLEPTSAPESVPEPAVAPTDKPVSDQESRDPTLDVTDPAKMDFVKTYTSEYDAVTERAMKAARSVLDAIDDTIHNHTDDIAIDQSVNEFVENPPKDGKVARFEDAQAIVKQIMQKAEDSKTQSEQAAREAAKIYDDIQKFKNDTEEEIDSIKSRDEFGRTIDKHDAKSSDLDAIKKFIH